MWLLWLPFAAWAAAEDDFSNYAVGLTSPYRHASSITPHDTNELTYVTRGIYIGGAGNVKVTTVEDETVTFNSAAVGQVLPVRAKIIFSSGTTATSIIALW